MRFGTSQPSVKQDLFDSSHRGSDGVMNASDMKKAAPFQVLFSSYFFFKKETAIEL